MLSASFPRKVIVFLLLAIVATPWASAAGPRLDDARPAKVATSPLDLLNRLWGFLTSVWSAEGCHIDPDGRCITPRTDTGCMIDPDGRCITPRTDEGCHIDPNGGCSS